MIITLAGVSGYYWYNNTHYVTTEDAGVDADVINVSPEIVFLSMLALEETPSNPKLRFDHVGFILCSSGRFFLLLALSKGQDWGWDSYSIVRFYYSNCYGEYHLAYDVFPE